MRILLFEDARAEDLTPIALVRRVFELICGRDSLRPAVATLVSGSGLWRLGQTLAGGCLC